MSDTQNNSVGTWALSPCQAHPAENAFTCGQSPEGNETALRDDSRALVDPKDIQPGGRYYSIVKLQIRYEKQEASDDRWAQGSGWLVRPDLLVTAGHCAFDHTYGLGRASEVKVYVGYAGKESIGQPGVQFRHGARIMTTSGWLKSDVNRHNDVSFILLDSPFQNIKPFSFQATPNRGTKMLGVVGYPADKTYKDEQAARMYAQFKSISFDLDSSFLNMLEYTISSYGGQSGSPVVVQGENTSIGTHVYGLGGKNSASVIRGQYGNFYRSCLNAMSGSIPAPQSGALWTVMDLPAAEETTTEAPRSEAEDFWSVFKKVANVGSQIGSSVLSVATPFLGPVGAPIAAVAGGALGVISKVTGESSMVGNDSKTIEPSTHKEHMCRAILAEGALDAVLRMQPETAHKYGVFEHMQKRFQEQKQYVPTLARAVGPAIMGPALRIALDSTVPQPANVSYPALPKPAATEFALGVSPWSHMISTSESTISGGETEGFFDFIKTVVDVGTKLAPVAINAATGIAGIIRGESAMEPSQDDLQPHFETVCHRALMGDAALEALMRIPPNEVQQEGFLSGIIDTVKNIGAKVIKVAPSVLRVVEPIAHQLIQQHLNPSKGESSGLEPARSLRSTKSTYDLLKEDHSTMPELPKVNESFYSDFYRRNGTLGGNPGIVSQIPTYASTVY